MIAIHPDAEAHAQDALLARRQASEHLGGGLTQIGLDRGIEWCDRVLVEDENAVTPLDSAIQANLREATTQVLACLTPREERILRMRFGIGMDSNHTLAEVGKQFSVTRERIRQIEAKTLRKLKHPHHSRKLRSFLDI